MADRFDVVAVGVEDVGGVVARVVLSTDPWRAVVASTEGECVRVEPLDGLAIGAGERDVRPSDRVAPSDPEVEAVLVREVGEHAVLLVDDAVPEWPEKLLVEPFRATPLTDVDRNVSDGHCRS